MADNRVAAARERKQDRVHASHGEQRAQAAAEARRRQAQAEAERIERANEEMRARRRNDARTSIVDRLDTSYQIDQLGGVGGGEGPEKAYVPMSLTERNYTVYEDDVNAALARGERGEVRYHSKSLLIGEDGAPKQRDNVLQRLDPTYRTTEEVYQWALRRFAQRARGKVAWERRWLTFRLYTEQKATPKQIALQLGVGEAQVYNYLSSARHYMQGLMEGRQDEAC